MSALVDPGAQNERTRLAWQRTLLSMLVCALVVARLVATESVVAGVLVALASLVLASTLTVLTRRRYASAQHALRGGAPLPDARLPVTMALLLGLVGVAAAALLLLWG